MSFVADISGVWTLFQKHSEISRCFTQHSPHHFCIVKLSLWLPSRDQMESKQDWKPGMPMTGAQVGQQTMRRPGEIFKRI